MITSEQRREIKRLTNAIVSSQVALAFNPADRCIKRNAAEDVDTLNKYLTSITKGN